MARDMIVRPITASELDQHFEVLCQAFQLDRQLAYPIYRQDPFFELSYKRALFDDRRILSVLTVIPACLHLRRTCRFSVAGIAGVGTPPAARRRGYAARLIKQTVAALPAEGGFSLAALECSRPDYYRQLGFERCSTAYDWRASPAVLPDRPGADHVVVLRPDQAEALSVQIRNVHESVAGARASAFDRDQRRWAAVETLTVNRRIAVLQSRGKVDAYLSFHEDRSGESASWIVHEIVAPTIEETRVLVAFLGRQANVMQIRGRTSATQYRELGLEGIDGVVLARSDGMMMRILDMPAVLEACSHAPGWPQTLAESTTGLTICVDNADYPQTAQRIRLFTFVDDRGAVQSVMGPADEIEGHWIAADIGALTQMTTGYASASALRRQGRLRASDDAAAALADELFTPTDLCLEFPDRF